MATTTKRFRTLDALLESLSRRDVLRHIAELQTFRARCDLYQTLLEQRLASLTSADSGKTTAPDELLKIPEVARILRIRLPRAYELARPGGDLPSVRVGVKQVRVRRRDLEQYLSGKKDH